MYTQSHNPLTFFILYSAESRECSSSNQQHTAAEPGGKQSFVPIPNCHRGIYSSISLFTMTMNSALFIDKISNHSCHRSYGNGLIVISCKVQREVGKGLIIGK